MPDAIVPLSYYLVLSAILFALGTAGFLFKRNIIVSLLSVELMLNAVNLSFVAFSYQFRQLDGQIFALFIMVVSVAEVVVGLAIVMAVFRRFLTLDSDEMDRLKL